MTLKKQIWKYTPQIASINKITYTETWGYYIQQHIAKRARKINKSVAPGDIQMLIYLNKNVLYLVNEWPKPVISNLYVLLQLQHSSLMQYVITRKRILNGKKFWKRCAFEAFLSFLDQ